MREIDRRDLLMPWRLSRREEVTPALPPVESLPGYLRPPGALDEAELIATCERCGKCKEACEFNAILPLGPAYGEADGTPAVLPRGNACQLCDDLPCAAACPSGALRVMPIRQVRMGTAVLDASRCWLSKGQPCDYCVTACPLGSEAITLDHGGPRISESACVGCGMCVSICAATPEALRIVPPHEQPTAAPPGAG